MQRHSTSIATAILPRQVPWQYAAIATALHGYCHGNFHGRRSTAISTENRGIPRPSAAIATEISALHGNCHGNFQYTAISTANHGIPWRLPPQFPRQLTRYFSRQTMTNCHGNFDGKPRHSAAIRGNCHGNFRTPRQSAVITTAISTAINGIYHVNRR